MTRLPRTAVSLLVAATTSLALISKDGVSVRLSGAMIAAAGLTGVGTTTDAGVEFVECECFALYAERWGLR